MNKTVADGATDNWTVILLGVGGVGLLLLVALVVGYMVGMQQADQAGGVAREQYDSVRLELSEAEQALLEQGEELEMLRMRYAVDRAALELVRSEMSAYKENALDLEERLQFFRSLISTTERPRGLSLRPVELVARPQAGRFAYRIVAQQEARKHELLEGTMEVEIVGRQGDFHLSYPLSALSDDVEEPEVELRFRYFQAVEGELSLPEGFEPEGVVVTATAVKPGKAEVQEQFSWQTREKFTNVGK